MHSLIYFSPLNTGIIIETRGLLSVVFLSIPAPHLFFKCSLICIVKVNAVYPADCMF